MKFKAWIWASIFLTGISCLYGFATSDLYFFLVNRFLWKKTFISYKEAFHRWGKSDFDSEGFRSGKLQTRSQMISSILRTKRFVGLSYDFATKELGPKDGSYFINDSILTYRIFEERNASGNLTESFDLVLLPSEDGKVERVVAWKSCCP